jgi:hypothetical protein
MHFVNIVIFSWKSGTKFDPVDLSGLGGRRERLPFFMPAFGSADAAVA